MKSLFNCKSLFVPMTKISVLRSLLLGVACSASFATPVQAQLSDDFTYPRAREIQDKENSAPDYRLVLGSILKVNGRLRAESDLMLSGTLSRKTWQLPSGHTPDDAIRFMRDRLQRERAQMLYQCQGRECGASNLWANDLFETARLYGVDNTQRYMAAQQGSNYYAVYTVQRGNGRVYLNIDQLTTTLKTGSDWMSDLIRQGYAEVPDWPDSPDKAVAALKLFFETHPAQHINLVVYQAGQDTELTLRQSQQLAEKLKARLVDAGVGAAQVSAYGVGSLVPQVMAGRQQIAVIVMRTGVR